MNKKKLKTIGTILSVLGMGCTFAANALDAQVMTIEMGEMISKEVTAQTVDLRQKLLAQMAENKM